MVCSIVTDLSKVGSGSLRNDRPDRRTEDLACRDRCCYLVRFAIKLIINTVMTAPNRYDSSECRNRVARNATVFTSVSDTPSWVRPPGCWAVPGCWARNGRADTGGFEFVAPLDARGDGAQQPNSGAVAFLALTFGRSSCLCRSFALHRAPRVTNLQT